MFSEHMYAMDLHILVGTKNMCLFHKPEELEILKFVTTSLHENARFFRKQMSKSVNMACLCGSGRLKSTPGTIIIAN
jgi:hypothetical protein